MSDFTIDGIPFDEFINTNANRTINITNSNLSEETNSSDLIDETVNQNIMITLQTGNNPITSNFERPQALLTIFDSPYYLDQNPDVAESVEGNFVSSRLDIGSGVPVEVFGASLYENTDGRDPNSSIPSFVDGIEHYV